MSSLNFRNELTYLVRLASPLLAAQIFTTAMGVVDTVMAGNYGAEDLAGVAIGSSVWLPIYLLVSGLLIGTTSMVSRFHGAEKPADIVTTVQQSLWMVLMAAALAVVLLLNITPLLDVMQISGSMQEITQHYLFGIAMGVPGAAIFSSLRAFSEGMGRTYPFMVSSCIAFLLNIPLNYSLIYGFGFLPELGGVGCGWATAVCMWVQVIVLMYFVTNPKRFDGVRLFSAWQWPQLKVIWNICRLGVPIAVAVFAEVSIFAVIALLLAPLGALAVASHQIALSTSHLIFMLPLSLSQALTIRVGYFLGRGQQGYANYVARVGITTAIVMALCSMTALLTFRENIVSWYTDDPEVTALAVALFFWMAVYQLPDHIQIACNATLRAYHDSRTPLLLILFSFWGIAMPLGYITGRTDWLVEPMAAAGFWLALVAGLTGTALLLSVRLWWRARQPLHEHT